MITADLANGYNRDVFAFPGRTTDAKSAGCNELVKNNKAMLLTDSRQLLQTMGWLADLPSKKKAQRELFIEMSAEEKQLLQLIQEKDSIHIDEINGRSGLSTSMVASAILNLELQNVIVSLPGKMFRMA
jgi:DNA processing protein